jgi:hypothetical protein
LVITAPHFEIRHANYEIAGSAPPDLPKRLKRAQIRCPRFKHPVTLNQVLDFIALSPDGQAQLEALQAKQPGKPLGVEINLDARGWTLIDRSRRYALTRIHVTALVTSETTHVSLSASNYGKTPVLHGYAHGTALGYSVNMAPATDPAAPIHIQVTQAGHHTL